MGTIKPQVYRYAIILAVFGTVVPSFLMGIGLRRAGAERFAILSTIGPVATVLLAWAFLGEAINATQLVGLLVTLSGGVLISLFKENARQPERKTTKVVVNSPGASRA